MNKELLDKYWVKYKADFGSESFKKSEAYKWNLFNQMYSIWNWKSDASNFEMYTKTFHVDGPKNLWQSGNFFPISMLTWMWEKFPIETEQALNILFDETVDLSNRMEKFASILDNKLPELAKLITEKPINQHYHGDLRAISIYLTLQNPSKYFLYKHTIFKDFSKALHLPPVKTGKSSNYLEYVMICNQIRDFIKEDKEFISTYTSYLADNNLYLDPHLHLLVQDFILSTTTQYSAYWVFQGNPTKYDFQNAIKEGSLTDWTASAHRDKFKIGDKVIFWLSGKDAGCYALGEINTEPFENDKQPDGNWKEEDHSEWKVGIQITHDLTSNPIFKEVIDATSEFKDLKVGHQGTNFTATKEEYEGLLDKFLERLQNKIT
jgi:5-methylcytosine-specific restriction protein B